MAKTIEQMNKAIEDFLKIAPKKAEKEVLDSHIANTSNPHTVTKAQVGLGSVDDVQQAAKTDFDAHASDKLNPHEVTKTQLGLGNVDDVQQAAKADFDAHEANKQNPHDVTKEQLGLGSVDNVRQAAKADFDAHADGTGARHTADDVDYSTEKTVKQKINELIIEGAGGTMYHEELQNRELPNQHPISAIEGLTEVIDPHQMIFVYEGVTPSSETLDSGDTELFMAPNPGFIDEDGEGYDGLDLRSKLVDDNGRLYLPPGFCACCELHVCGTQYGNPKNDKGEIISNDIIIDGRNAGGFHSDGFLMRLNSVGFFIGEIVSTQFVDRVKNEVLPRLEVKFDTAMAHNYGLKEIGLYVKGVPDIPMKWRAVLRIKNILNVFKKADDNTAGV